jgi:HlyD family secretion protein
VTENLFRKESLEKLNASDQLDHLIQITVPRGWLILFGIGFLLLFILIWSIWGNIPYEVKGQGILMKSSGVAEIASPGNGRVKDVFVNVNDIIQKGQVVASIEQPDLIDQINKAKAVLEEKEIKYNKAIKFGIEHLRLEEDSMLQQKIDLESNLKNLSSHLDYLKNTYDNQEQLLQRGVITKQQLINTKRDIDLATQDIDNINQQLKKISIHRLELKNQKDQELFDYKQEVENVKRNIKTLERQLNQQENVVSVYSGRVVEISKEKGNVVNEGTVVISLELSNEENDPLQALIYFPPAAGKRIHMGMKVHVSPLTVKQEEYGSILGTVTFVSEFPATAGGMLRVLKNQQMIENFLRNGAPIEVQVKLENDSNTYSGFKWSSSKGPVVKIRAGTVCAASAVVEQQRPISLVIPLFKRKILGIGQYQ